MTCTNVEIDRAIRESMLKRMHDYHVNSIAGLLSGLLVEGEMKVAVLLFLWVSKDTVQVCVSFTDDFQWLAVICRMLWERRQNRECSGCGYKKLIK